MPSKTNCTVHGKAKYRIRRKIGEDESGKPVFKNFYGKGKLDAERAAEAYLSEERGDNRATFGQLAEYYTYNIFIHEPLAPTTIELYVRAYRKQLKPVRWLMIKMIKDVRLADIQRLINDKSGAPSATTNLIKYLKYLFRYLEREGYCRNLISLVTIPRFEKKPEPITVFTREEVAKILSTPSDLHFLFSFAFSTGLRMGELLALNIEDVKDGFVYVNKQVETFTVYDEDGYQSTQVAIRPPKSKNSVRSVPLPQNVNNELLEYIQGRAGLLFCTASGKLINKGNLRRAWQRHLRRAGVEYKKFHACRSTYCTMLCEQGVPLETASRLMGHSSINITAEFYRAISTEEFRSAAAKIDHIFEPSGD